MASRVILITGANRGIGYCITQALAARSPTDTLLVASRTKSKAEEAIKQLQVDSAVQNPIHAVELDVTNETTIEHARTWIEQQFGRLDGTHPLLTPAFIYTTDIRHPSSH